jgi:hypothetical protein
LGGPTTPTKGHKKWLVFVSLLNLFTLSSTDYVGRLSKEIKNETAPAPLREKKLPIRLFVAQRCGGLIYNLGSAFGWPFDVSQLTGTTALTDVGSRDMIQTNV